MRSPLPHRSAGFAFWGGRLNRGRGELGVGVSATMTACISPGEFGGRRRMRWRQWRGREFRRGGGWAVGVISGWQWVSWLSRRGWRVACPRRGCRWVWAVPPAPGECCLSGCRCGGSLRFHAMAASAGDRRAAKAAANTTQTIQASNSIGTSQRGVSLPGVSSTGACSLAVVPADGGGGGHGLRRCLPALDAGGLTVLHPDGSSTLGSILGVCCPFHRGLRSDVIDGLTCRAGHGLSRLSQGSADGGGRARRPPVRGHLGRLFCPAAQASRAAAQWPGGILEMHCSCRFTHLERGQSPACSIKRSADGSSALSLPLNFDGRAVFRPVIQQT